MQLQLQLTSLNQSAEFHVIHNFTFYRETVRQKSPALFCLLQFTSQQDESCELHSSAEVFIYCTTCVQEMKVLLLHKKKEYKMKTVTVLSSLAFLVLRQLRREVLKILNSYCQITKYYFFSPMTEIGYRSHMMCIGLNICLFLCTCVLLFPSVGNKWLFCNCIFCPVFVSSLHYCTYHKSSWKARNRMFVYDPYYCYCLFCIKLYNLVFTLKWLFSSYSEWVQETVR